MSTYTATTVPTPFIEANGIRFAYRRWGKRSGLPLVFNQHFTGNLDNWDPAVLDGLAKEREVIIFSNAGVAGFSIGGMVAQQITLDRPEIVRKLTLAGTAARKHDAGNGQGHITPETAAIFGATYDPPRIYGSRFSSRTLRRAKPQVASS
jgi:pimeloyl-ACP methyl ester carboxylesterase